MQKWVRTSFAAIFADIPRGYDVQAYGVPSSRYKKRIQLG